MFSLLSMLWPNTDTFFIPTIKSYINNGNVIFSIQTKGYCALWLQIVKFIAWWYTVMSFNIRFVAPWKYTAHFLCEIFIFQQQSLVILIKTIKIPVQYNHYPCTRLMPPFRYFVLSKGIKLFKVTCGGIWYLDFLVTLLWKNCTRVE